MRSRIAFTGLIVAALLSYGLGRMLRSRTHRRARLETDVVIATHELKMGMWINDEDVQVGSRSDAVPPGCILQKDQVIGRRVVIPMPTGTMICASDVAELEEASFTTPSMRALWVPVSQAAGAISLKSGARVDVSVTRAFGSRLTDQTTAVLKDVLVLAVHQETKSNLEGKGLIVQVALLVSPDDAQKLIAARGHARLQLSKMKALGAQQLQASEGKRR